MRRERCRVHDRPRCSGGDQHHCTMHVAEACDFAPRWTDWRGTPIDVGSTVLYAVSHSSSLVMTEALVVELEEHQTERDYEPETYKPRRDYCRRCKSDMACTGWNVKVRPLRDAGILAGLRDRPAREVWLTATDRVTVLF